MAARACTRAQLLRQTEQQPHTPLASLPQFPTKILKMSQALHPPSQQAHADLTDETSVIPVYSRGPPVQSPDCGCQATAAQLPHNSGSRETGELQQKRPETAGTSRPILASEKHDGTDGSKSALPVEPRDFILSDLWGFSCCFEQAHGVQNTSSP